MKVISIFIILCLTIGFLPSCKKAAKPKNFKGDWILEFSRSGYGILESVGNKTFYMDIVTITKQEWGIPINGSYSFSQYDETAGYWDSSSKSTGKETGTIT